MPWRRGPTYRVTPPVETEIHSELQEVLQKKLWRALSSKTSPCRVTEQSWSTHNYNNVIQTVHVTARDVCSELNYQVYNIQSRSNLSGKKNLTSVTGCLCMHTVLHVAYLKEYKINIKPGLYSVPTLSSFVKIFPYECHWLASSILAVAYLTKTNQPTGFLPLSVPTSHSYSVLSISFFSFQQSFYIKMLSHRYPSHTNPI